MKPEKLYPTMIPGNSASLSISTSTGGKIALKYLSEKVGKRVEETKLGGWDGKEKADDV